MKRVANRPTNDGRESAEPIVMRKRWAFVAGGVIGAGLLVRWQLARLFTEEPDYVVEERMGALEIRQYRERVVAQTYVDGQDWDRALNEGFRRLAGYIFGGNQSKGRKRIAMTAPVNVAPGGQRIAMTAPVGAERSQRGWTITFTMPANSTVDSLPIPDDSRVVLKTIEPARVAALRFRGRYNSANVTAAFDRLRDLVRQHGLETEGEPQFAGYDPPSTLPLLRRNEVWIALAR